MNVEEYRESLHEDIALEAKTNASNLEEEFLNCVVGILKDGEEFDDFTECYYEGINKKNAKMQFDGYSFDQADESCCVFIEDYRGPGEDESIRSQDIKKLFNYIYYFVKSSIEYKLYENLEESTEFYEFSKFLYENHNEISKFRFYLLTDAFNKQKVKNIKATEIANKVVEQNVWDINRIFELVSSKAQKESVEIDFEDMNYEGIPCVKAVEYHDIIADIETVDKNNSCESNNISNKITYTSYLAVVPGEILNQLYLEYGARLLEGNVRSFLSVRGKVNKNIQKTIKNYPEMFFAYNNGIAATATEMDTAMTNDGLKIIKIKDLQIVNGGQTTASIANTILSAKSNETINLKSIFVPMKISVLERESSERIIPKISEYSNSQNKVDASDFFSNHPFHIRIEEYSRKTPAPAIDGNQYQQYWFYERTRGQYNQGKMKFKAKSANLNKYLLKYPEKQVIKMVELLKYMKIYDGRPDIVSKGKQTIVKAFAPEIAAQWNENNTIFNDYYFKRVVAIAIIFNKTDNIIKKTSWYLQKHSYKANVIAYTLSVLFNYVRKNKKGYEVDFLKIWNDQDIYKELEEQIKDLCTEVYLFINDDSRATENVTEWCKKSLCWERAEKADWTINQAFLDTLVSKNNIKKDLNEAKANREVANEIDDIKLIINYGGEYWGNVLSWGRQRSLLSLKELNLLKMASNIRLTGKIPSDKQSKVILKTRERMISMGMPIQF